MLLGQLVIKTPKIWQLLLGRGYTITVTCLFLFAFMADITRNLEHEIKVILKVFIAKEACIFATPSL